MKGISQYNLEHKGVKCTEARWNSKPIKFQFVYKGNYIVYEQQGEFHCNADTDHIRMAIEEFLLSQKGKPRTNFDRITESAEAFADWIFKSYTNVPENVPCTVENCETTDRMDCKKCFIKWLQKECEND